MNEALWERRRDNVVEKEKAETKMTRRNDDQNYSRGALPPENFVEKTRRDKRFGNSLYLRIGTRLNLDDVCWEDWTLLEADEDGVGSREVKQSFHGKKCHLRRSDPLRHWRRVFHEMPKWGTAK